MKNILLILVLATLGVVATSCGSSRNATGTGSEMTTSKSGIADYARYGKWNTLSCGGKVTLGGGKSLSSSMQLKMVRGKSISISIRPLLGIEMAKIYIADDEIVILDRYHRMYVKEKASLLTSGVPVDVTTMQDILLGRAHILGKGTLSMSMAGDVDIVMTKTGTTVISPKNQYEGFEYRYTFDANKLISSLEVAPSGEASIYTVNYGNVETTVAGNVSTATNVATNIMGKALNLNLSLKNLTWNSDIKDELTIPEGYSKADGSSIMKALGGTVR